MPTSSERLKVRAHVYMEAYDYLTKASEASNDAFESLEYWRLADRLKADYDRLKKLSEVRAEKEKELEHRRRVK